MNLFDENLDIISRRNAPDFIAEMEMGETPFEYLGTDEDGVKVFCDSDGRPFIIDQVIDEAHLPNPNLKQLIFFFGIGSIQEIQNVARYANSQSLFVIIEPNPYFLQHALYYESFKGLEDINYIIVTEKADNLSELLRILFLTKFFYLVKNILFYLSSYYRKYDGGSVNEYIIKIGTVIKNRSFLTGNSIQDSLIGLGNNLKNIRALTDNVDVAKLKDVFSGIPAFVISAGPSLDKNISELKAVQGKGLIIAVDTIVQKLLDNGIIPDFICTVERGAIVWEYFYENIDYPSNLYLVSSLVADPRIIDKFSDKAILPMRSNVREYYWLSEMLGLTPDHFLWMGASCAHIATGFAYHVGASPIVLVGQDLAYGETGTHANGTVYDNKPMNEEEGELLTPGYYGGQVRTRKIWMEFKSIFESKFEKSDRMVINATEGGAKIEGTIQRTLQDVIKEFCIQDCHVLERVQSVLNCNIDWESVEYRISHYITNLEKTRLIVAKHLKKLKEYELNWSDVMSEKKVNEIYKTMKKTDEFYKAIYEDQLLFHNIQGPLTIIMQKFNAIEETESLTCLRENLKIQIDLCEILENTMWLIFQVVQENFLISGKERKA